MSLSSWPSGVDYRPIVGSLNIAQTTEAPLVSEMNAGTVRARRKYTIRIGKMSFSLFLNYAQAATLQSFHEATLYDGAARFTMPLYFGGQIVTRTVRFATPPTYADFGAGVRVGVSLLVENL